MYPTIFHRPFAPFRTFALLLSSIIDPVAFLFILPCICYPIHLLVAQTSLFQLFHLLFFSFYAEFSGHGFTLFHFLFPKHPSLICFLFLLLFCSFSCDIEYIAYHL